MLYLTLLFEKAREKEYMMYTKVGLQAADNVFQWNVLEGLKANRGDRHIRILNSVPMGNFPKYSNKIYFANEEVSLEQQITMKNLGFLNLPILKPLIRYQQYKRELKKAYQNGEKQVVIYGLYLPQLLAARKVKGLETTLIVDDLPAQYGLISGNKIAVYLKTLLGRWTMRILDNEQVINHFVFLTEHMKDVIQLKGRDYVVVEGIANDRQKINVAKQASSDKKVIFYAGTLNEEFGICSLLHAFQLIPSDQYELWICGDGDARETVQDAVKTDSRIRYWGFVEKEKADELQEQATVLVNPRKAVGEYTKYSFPSKTIEYLLAAKPVVMYKLAGIPKEYDKYLHYVIEDTKESLADKLIEVCEDKDGQMTRLAIEARQWVLEHKNAKVQMEELVKLWENGV